MSNYLELRQQRSSMASDVPYQFPDVYRHYHPKFIEFVEAYYYAIEDTQKLRFRDAALYRNVDSSFDTFLDSFRKKYLADFPNTDDDTAKFIIKHISDLYKRKGTEESLRMLFRLFYQEEIEVNYPGKLVFKTSDSVYRSSNYIEMKPVNSVDDYPITPGNYIKGDVSKAQAYVDSVVFKNFQGAIVPIVYISNLAGGTFLKDDSLTMEKFDGTSTIIGRLIQGSISNVEILPGGRSDENKEGDVFDVVSDTGGIVGRVIATQIEELETGSIDFEVVDEGYGYSYLNDPLENPIGVAEVYSTDSVVPKGTRVIDLHRIPFTLNVKSLRYAVRFVTPGVLYNKETYYNISEVDTVQLGDKSVARITLAKPLEEDVPVANTSVNFYHYAQVSDIITSNQTFVVDSDIGTPEPQDGVTIIQPEDLYLQLSDRVEVNSVIEAENAFSENVVLNQQLNKYRAIGVAEVLSYDDPLVYVNANESPFRVEIKEEFITDYKYYTSTNGLPANFSYKVGDFVRYPAHSDDAVVYECIRNHLPQVQLNPIYFREPILDRIPDNARLALNVTRNGTYVGTFYIKTMAPYNDSAGFRISEIKNSENLQVITDKVGTALNTQINSERYPLSGASSATSVNINTTLENAFESVDLTIGEVADIQILNNGADFENDLKSVVRQNYIYQRNQRDLIIKFEDQVEVWSTTTFEPTYTSEEDTNQRTLLIKDVAKDIFTLTYDGIDVDVVIDLDNTAELKKSLQAWINDKPEDDREKAELNARLAVANKKQLAVLSIKRQIDEALVDVINPAVNITGSANDGSDNNGLEFSIGTINSVVSIPKANIESEAQYPVYGQFSDYFTMIPGEVLQQVIEVNDIVYQNNSYNVKLEYIGTYNSKHYFRQRSFYRLDENEPLVQAKRPDVRFIVSSYTTDLTSNAMGNNALVDGSVYFARGQLQSVNVINSGYRYKDGEIVKLVNPNTGETAARAKITVAGTGISQGEWVTFNSFTSDPTVTNFLHDNDYYQEYSYDISSIINTEKYGAVISDLVQVSGTKQFNTPLINSRDALNMNVDVALEVYDLSEEVIQAESFDPDGDKILQGIEAFDIDGIQGELVAVIATLDEDAGTQI